MFDDRAGHSRLQRPREACARTRKRSRNRRAAAAIVVTQLAVGDHGGRDPPEPERSRFDRARGATRSIVPVPHPTPSTESASITRSV